MLTLSVAGVCVQAREESASAEETCGTENRCSIGSSQSSCAKAGTSPVGTDEEANRYGEKGYQTRTSCESTAALECSPWPISTNLTPTTLSSSSPWPHAPGSMGRTLSSDKSWRASLLCKPSQPVAARGAHRVRTSSSRIAESYSTLGCASSESRVLHTQILCSLWMRRCHRHRNRNGAAVGVSLFLF